MTEARSRPTVLIMQAGAKLEKSPLLMFIMLARLEKSHPAVIMQAKLEPEKIHPDAYNAGRFWGQLAIS